MSLIAVTTINNSNIHKHLETSAPYLPRFVSAIAIYISTQFLLLFFKPSYERNYYNLTNHLFTQEKTTYEETSIFVLFKEISEARTSDSLKNIQKKANSLTSKNSRCMLVQALSIAKSSKAHFSVKTFLANELTKLENDTTQNSCFIPTPDRTLSSTLIKVGLISGAVLLTCGLVYYGYYTGILSRIFSSVPSHAVQTAVETDPTLISPTKIAPPVQLSSFQSPMILEVSNGTAVPPSLAPILSCEPEIMNTIDAAEKIFQQMCVFEQEENVSELIRLRCNEAVLSNKLRFFESMLTLRTSFRESPTKETILECHYHLNKIFNAMREYSMALKDCFANSPNSIYC